MTIRDEIKKQVSITLSNTASNTVIDEPFDIIYENTLVSLLIEYQWNFCKTVWKLYNNQSLTNTDPQYKFAYNLPNDCIDMIIIANNNNVYSFNVISDTREIDYILRKKIIYTSFGITEDSTMPNKLYLYLYGLSRADEELFPEYFIEVLVYKLAIKLCLKVVDSADKLQFYQQAYQDRLDVALSIDARKTIPPYLPNSDLIEAKFV